MSLAYPNVPLRRGDIYKIRLPRVEDPSKGDVHPALVLRDERYEDPRATFTIVAYGTSVQNFKNHPLALPIDPAIVTSVNLTEVTYFLAHRLHSINKKKYLSGAKYLGRLPKKLMDRFDELLALALQLTEYKEFP